ATSSKQSTLILRRSDPRWNLSRDSMPRAAISSVFNIWRVHRKHRKKSREIYRSEFLPVSMRSFIHLGDSALIWSIFISTRLYSKLNGEQAMCALANSKEIA